MGLLTKAGTALKQWSLANEDTGETLKGQYATEFGLEVRNNWRHHTALSRARAVSQFINCEVDRISLPVLFYALSEIDGVTLTNNIEKLIAWSKPTQALNRPAIITFYVGNGFFTRKCVIAGLSDVKFAEPTSTGQLRQVTLTIQLDSYAEFKIDENSSYETRYHRARERDYYEMLTWREYKDPLIGDVIRKRHPESAQIIPGDIIKLPSIEAIQSDIVEPKSTTLMTSFGRKATAQRALRIDWFNRRNTKFVSHVVK